MLEPSSHHRAPVTALGRPGVAVVVSSPAFAPPVAKILSPQEWLTVAQVREAL